MSSGKNIRRGAAQVFLTNKRNPQSQKASQKKPQQKSHYYHDMPIRRASPVHRHQRQAARTPTYVPKTYDLLRAAAFYIQSLLIISDMDQVIINRNNIILTGSDGVGLLRMPSSVSPDEYPSCTRCFKATC